MPVTVGVNMLSVVHKDSNGVTIAFLDLYLKGMAAAHARMFSAGNVTGVSTVQGSG